jgi:hypothetical protein
MRASIALNDKRPAKHKVKTAKIPKMYNDGGHGISTENGGP